MTFKSPAADALKIHDIYKILIQNLLPSYWGYSHRILLYNNLVCVGWRNCMHPR